MPENNRNQDNSGNNAASKGQNIVQSATGYVQYALENAVDTTRDATQNLVNQVVNRENEEKSEQNDQ